MEKIVISDTNILIDLLTMGLLSDFFALPYEFHTSNLVMDEVEQMRQKEDITEMVRKGYLIVDEIKPEEMPMVVSLIDGNLSITDCSIWHLAKINKWTMLSGDKRLRTRAKADNIPVRGILFILDELVRCNVVSSLYAAEKLEYLSTVNIRLPKDEIAGRLHIWTDLKILNEK